MFLRKFISIGQKTKSDEPLHPYGQGFNYWIEVGWSVNKKGPATRTVSEDEIERRFREVRRVLDHKLIGVDVKLAVDAESGELCRWISQTLQLESAIEGIVVRLLRGDGFTVSAQA